MILQKLATEVVEGNTETIDIFALCIRGIINETSEERSQGIITTLYPMLLKGI
jgi:hypothetical protein